MRVLYIDCFSGISGDMMAGALIDAGASPERIERELEKLGVGGYRLEWRKTVKEGISSTKFDVILEDEAHHHHHQNDHGHGGHTHQHHRHYADIVKLVELSELEAGIKKRIKDIFAPIAEAEAKIHDIPVEKVHFHEVGAVDSIVDIAAVAIALEELGIEKVISTHVPLGSGHIHIDHGVYPVPAPATLEMMKDIPIAPTDLKFEMTTPTGAGIIASQADGFGPIPAMKVETIGYGAGTKDVPGRPNVLRVMVGELIKENKMKDCLTETVTVIECQIDDMTGESFGYVMDQLLDTGALDVYYTPVFMKKNRPGILVTVLSPNELDGALTNLLLKETTTLGVRKTTWVRTMLERHIVSVHTPYGSMRLKQARQNGAVIREVPEYEDVKKAAKLHKVPFQQVYDAVLAARM